MKNDKNFYYNTKKKKREHLKIVRNYVETSFKFQTFKTS